MRTDLAGLGVADPSPAGNRLPSDMRKQAPAAHSAKPLHLRDLRGPQATGRIAKLFIGQGHGFIQLSNHGEVFFHRADLKEGAEFNDLQIGDAVTFELFEDAISGARALHVDRLDRLR
jgi:cold shock CspA family protein